MKFIDIKTTFAKVKLSASEGISEGGLSAEVLEKERQRKVLTMSKVLLAVTLAVIFVTACTRTVNVFIPKMDTYTNRKYGFSIQYPASWRVESGTIGSVVGLISTSRKPDNVLIGSEKLPPKFDLQEYNSEFYRQLKEAALSYQEVQEYKARIAGEPAIVTIYKVTYKMTPDSIYKQMTVNLTKEGIAYTITCTGSGDYAYRANDVFDKIIRSFKFVSKELPLPTPSYARETSSKMGVYKDSAYNFSIQYPENWNVLPNYAGNAVWFSEPRTQETMNEGYTTNVAVVRPSRWPIPLEDFVRKAEVEYKKNQPSYKRLKKYRTTIYGKPAIILVFTIFLEEKKIALRSKHAFLTKGENLYIITCNALEEKYDESNDIFDKMIYSFALPR